MTRSYGPKTRTQAEKLAEAINFVWFASDNAISSATAQTIAQMKGVTKAKDIAAIGDALAKRREAL
jgi:hypothetical protein